MSLIDLIRNMFGQRQEPDDVTSKEIELWGDGIEDYNKVHRELEFARAMGFEGTPAQGTLVFGRAERYWALNSDFLMDGQSLHPVHVHVDYRKPLFPGEHVRWEFSDFADGPLDTYDCGRSCFVFTGKKLHTLQDAINVRVTVGTYRLPLPPQKERDVRLYTDKKSITPEKLAMCNTALRRTNSGDIPFSVPAALPLSSLLTISESEGLVSKFAVYPLGQPHLGPVDITLAIPPPKVLSEKLASILGKRFSYNIRATVTQNGLPISGLDISCYSNTKFYGDQHHH